MQNLASSTDDELHPAVEPPLPNREPLTTAAAPLPVTPVSESLAEPVIAKPTRALSIAEQIDALTAPKFMTSLARGLAVIKAFSDHRRAMTIAQLSLKTGIPRAAVRRCLYTLKQLGYAD
jgi:IclR family pca regulon transcriptional regulator